MTMTEGERVDTPQDDQRREGGVPFVAAVSSGLVDHAGLSDDVEAVLNPAMADAATTALLQGGEHAPAPPLPRRPADGAAKTDWVEYVVALGASRAFVEGESAHWTGVGYAPATGLTVEELKALAAWIGG